jgi:hypothetical protein
VPAAEIIKFHIYLMERNAKLFVRSISLFLFSSHSFLFYYFTVGKRRSKDSVDLSRRD